MTRRAPGTRRLTAWLAIFSLLVQVLLPAAVQAAVPSGFDVTEICTAVGIKKIVSEADQTGTATPEKHCPFCSFGDQASLPSTIFGASAYAQGVPVTPLLSSGEDYAAPRLLAYLRGPPLPF